MLKSISIRNYGSNRRLDIDLDEQITCLTGESYTGKSWAIRALKWVSLNRPAGISFIRWGSKRSIVTVTTDKHSIARKRSKAENAYVVDGTPLHAFGNNVPSKVQKILNLSDLNFQTQQEMPHGVGPLFWFALGPGEVAKRLNKIVNLDLIDRTLGNLSKLVHRGKVERDVCRERRKEARDKAEELAFVEEMAMEWEEVSLAIADTKAIRDDMDALEGLLQEVLRQKLTIDGDRSHIQQADRELAKLEILREAIVEIQQEDKDLSFALDEIMQLEQDRKESLEERMYAADDYAKATKGRCPLCGRK